MGNGTGFRLIVLIVTLAGGVVACARAPDPGLDAEAGAVFDQVKRHDFGTVENRLAPRLRTAVTDARLRTAAELIPDAPPRSIKTLSFEAADTPAGRDAKAVREYFYPDRMLLVTTAIRDQAGQPPIVVAFNLQPFSAAALDAARFHLAGKSSIQYLALGLAAAIPLFLVFALITLARDKAATWKWLWTLFILLGFAKLSVNWSTGAVLFQPLGAQLFGAAITKAGTDVSPWIVTLSAPVGAMIYVLRVFLTIAPDDPV